MIIIQHANNKVFKVESQQHDFSCYEGKNVTYALREIANKCQDQLIIWCDVAVREFINVKGVVEVMNSNRKLISFTPQLNFLSADIGYIEDSPFININKTVSYPTWQMSSCAGAVNSETVNQFDPFFFTIKNFNLFLTRVAKHYMPLGLFCYSEPSILNDGVAYKQEKASTIVLFQFVNQHYKKVWKYLLFFNVIFYEKRICFFSLLIAMVTPIKKYSQKIHFMEYEDATIVNKEDESIDVIIPTIGRKKYLWDVLIDLSNQTHLPKNVIIVEQNADSNLGSELDFLKTKDWPFSIDHTFTHQLGACNARNIALSKVKSKWVFLNDDDNRFTAHLLENSIKSLLKLKRDSLITSYLVPGETKTYTKTAQTTIFGSGNSFIHSKVLEKVQFDINFEFGYGEDTDFGMQMRNNGYDIIYDPTIEICHLKAPMGGFRTKFVHPWESDKIQPKPSPTIMLIRQKFNSLQQIRGFKTRLFLSLLKRNNYVRLISFVNNFNLAWKSSVFWSNKLRNQCR